MTMLMTSMLIATISLVILSLLVVFLMFWFPPTSTILMEGAMEQEHQKHQHMEYVLKAIISGEALVYLGVNLKLLYRWVSGLVFRTMIL